MLFLNRLRVIYDRKTKVKLIFLLAAIVFGSILEMLALSLISPFISVLLDHTILETNPYFHFIYELLHFSKPSSFLALLAFALFFLYVFRGVYLFFVNKAQYRFLAKRRVQLSDKILRKVLNRPYVYHANHNSAELQRSIITDVDELNLLLTNALLLLTDLFMVSFIFIFLLIVSPIMTFSILLLSFICLAVYFKAFRKKIKQVGAENRTQHISMLKTVNQALGGVKEIKVMHKELHFQQAFKHSSDLFVDANQKYQVMNSLPKLFIESFCFGITFLVVGFLILRDIQLELLVPQLSMFVIAAFRLLPAVSRVAAYANNIIFYREAATAVHKNLFSPDEYAADYIPQMPAALSPTQDILVHQVTFSYPSSPAPVLQDVSLSLPHNQSIAFVGPSGAGKTTLSDIILGVLSPQQGSVIHNGKAIHENIEEWTSYVGYIPQQIYLLDETILENVAFGICVEKIDINAVWRALEQAQLKDFVAALPDGLHTIIGDRGVRISGGQRQRIGIARALYNNPEILVLDEATSSLDTETESAIMEAIKSFQNHKTIIIVAHRLSTIEHCDIVYRIADGAVHRER